MRFTKLKLKYFLNWSLFEAWKKVDMVPFKKIEMNFESPERHRIKSFSIYYLKLLVWPTCTDHPIWNKYYKSIFHCGISDRIIMKQMIHQSQSRWYFEITRPRLPCKAGKGIDADKIVHVHIPCSLSRPECLAMAKKPRKAWPANNPNFADA